MSGRPNGPEATALTNGMEFAAPSPVVRVPDAVEVVVRERLKTARLCLPCVADVVVKPRHLVDAALRRIAPALTINFAICARCLGVRPTYRLNSR